MQPCRNCSRAAARQVVERFGEVFPVSPGRRRSLLAWAIIPLQPSVRRPPPDAPCAVVDGNVYQVLSGSSTLDGPIDTTARKQTFTSLANLAWTLRSRADWLLSDHGLNYQCTQLPCYECVHLRTVPALAARSPTAC